MKYTRLLTLICAFSLITLFTGCPQKPSDPVPPKTILTDLFPTSYEGAKGNLWTIMVYMDGDNNLEAAAIEDFNEMEAGLFAAKVQDPSIESKINIIVLFDRIPGEDSSNGNWTNTRLYKVKPDTNPDFINSELIYDSPEQNLGDPNLLKNFISWSKSNFPATNYALVLWNHGGGARSRNTTPSTTVTGDKNVKAICWDDTNNGDCLYLEEVQQAIGANFSSTDKLSVLGFDACLMGMVEVAYEFRNLAKYMVASMHTEQGDGWDYEYILNRIATGSIKNYSGSSTFNFTAGNPSPEDF
ncbi:MAG TPA: clostripain-related cysteine peptidase, partial [Spirochaetales bacterium]|nr:clostripain-related cysteine peptidase [Spirochaetales bacterium]